MYNIHTWQARSQKICVGKPKILGPSDACLSKKKQFLMIFSICLHNRLCYGKIEKRIQILFFY